MKSRRTLGIFFLSWIAIAAASCGALAQEPLQAVVSPHDIAIGAFYNGAEVKITGEVPMDSEVLVRITGRVSDLHLKKKGKALGLLWMNMDTISFENVPNVYLLYTSKPFEDLLGPTPEGVAVRDLGLPALESRITIKPESADKKVLFQEFLKLKESEGLYDVKTGPVRFLKPVGNRKPFEALLEIPSRLPPGEYRVEVYAVGEGRIVASTTQSLEVKLEGFPAMLSLLAFNHGALFGILATVVALVAGLLMGFVFGGGKGGH